MDHFKHQKVQNLSQTRKSQYLKRAIQIKSQYLKRAIQIIISVSVISFIFCQSSIPQYINAYFSTVSTYSSERNYMFLLCNGILVFLVKNSGLIDNSAQETNGLLDVVEQVKNNYGSPCSAPELPSTKKTLVAVELVEEIDEEHEQNDGLFFITEDVDNNEEEEDEEHEQNDGLFFITEDVDNNEEEEKEEEEEGPNELLVATSEQEDCMGFLSTEELNKKCDEFIRKMKQDIKFEAQLIVI